MCTERIYTVCIQLTVQAEEVKNNEKYLSRNPGQGVYMHCQIDFLPPFQCQGPPRGVGRGQKIQSGFQLTILR